MKNIILISDTHSYLDRRIVEHLSGVDEIWHAGDIGSQEVINELRAKASLKAVYGNIDDAVMRKAFPENQVFQSENLRVCMIHIAGYPGHYTQRARKLILLHKPDLFICGHSHILRVMNDKKYNHLHLNPGAAGKYGIHKVQTVLRFRIDVNKISDLEVIEFKRL